MSSIVIIAKDGTPALYALVAKLLRAVCEETHLYFGFVVLTLFPATVIESVIISSNPAISQT